MEMERMDSSSSLGSSISYSNRQCIIAVPSNLKEKILREGYTCSKRDGVPITLVNDPQMAVKAMREHNAVPETVVLEVFGVAEELIDRENSKIKLTHLPSEHLSDGCIFGRQISEYEEAPCPFCEQKIEGLAEFRGRVGEHKYFEDGVFICCPCPNDHCKMEQKERQERLNKAGSIRKYHQTSAAHAAEIKKFGKMIRGKGGAGGDGIYLADEILQTEWKTEHHGVVLECEVLLGCMKEVRQHNKKAAPYTFAKLVQEKCDSIKIDRGKVPGGPHKDQSSGDEYVVYSWDQVRVIREVPRQKRTCECCKNKPDKP